MAANRIATDFWGQLTQHECDALLRIAKRHMFRAGEFVFRVGERKPAVHILLSGRLKFFRLSPAGREVILWFCFPGEIFGLSEVPAAKGRRVNVQACEASEVALVPDAAFSRYLDRHPRAARLCRRTMAARLGLLTNALVNAVTDDATSRVAKLVLHLALQHGERRGEGIDLGVPMSHQEIANMAGVNRQTATRILGELRDRGIVTINRRRICVNSEYRLGHYIRGALRVA